MDQISKFGEIRDWDETKRRARLKEIGLEIRNLTNEVGTTELLCDELYTPLIDEAIILLLETCRSAFDKKSSLETLSYILEDVGFRSTCLGLVTIRFRDTVEIIEQYREKRGYEKEALKEELVVRGII